MSRRDRIRNESEQVLRERRKPLHNVELAEIVLPRLGISGMTAKDLNTCLHDDPKARFVRVGRGTWTLKDLGVR